MPNYKLPKEIIYTMNINMFKKKLERHGGLALNILRAE